MKSIHLTDETLQAFLLTEMQDHAISAHLAACPSCHEQLEKYKHLMVDISKGKPEAFSFDITAMVMDKVMRYEQKQNKRKSFVFWSLLISLIIAIVSLSMPYIPAVVTVFYANSVSSSLLLIGTGLMALLFLLVEIMREYKTKEAKIFHDKLQPLS